MYSKNTYHLINSNEYEYYFKGNYGAKGEKRAKKVKPTPEQIKANNMHNKKKRVRRKIKANFFPGDMWITLKYPEGTRKTIDEVVNDFKLFINRLKYHYKKHNEVCKYMYRIEVGKLGGIHIHMLLNRTVNTYDILRKIWRNPVNITPIYEMGGYEQLASYLVKIPDKDDEAYEQLMLFGENERKTLTKYGCSRNLVTPEPEVKPYTRRTVESLIVNGPKASEGYYIDMDTYRHGVNPFTGMSYVCYTEVRIKEMDRNEYEKYNADNKGVAYMGSSKYRCCTGAGWTKNRKRKRRADNGGVLLRMRIHL